MGALRPIGIPASSQPARPGGDPAYRDGGAQHPPHLAVDACLLGGPELADRPAWMNPGSPEDLIGEEVAQAGNDRAGDRAALSRTAWR
jgi:hypothetical protein